MAVGLQSSIDVEASPVISSPGWLSQPSTWVWIWFVIAVLTVMGFHIKVLGQSIPPTVG